VTGRGRAVAIVLLVLSIAGAGLARSTLASYPQSTGEKDLLYLPNGKYLRVLSLGQAPVVADVVYLWAIQYYSDYDRADRYRYVATCPSPGASPCAIRRTGSDFK